jgi:hypothetical protein
MLSSTQRKILATVAKNGGSYGSIWSLSLQLDVTYVTAWRNVQALRINGHLKIEIGPTPTGRAARLSLPGGNNFPLHVLANTVKTDDSSFGQFGRVPVLTTRDLWRIANTMTDEYIPPTLDRNEQGQAVLVADKIHRLHDLKKRQYYILAITAENMRLVKQVNDLRAMLGMPPVDVHTADPSRIG